MGCGCKQTNKHNLHILFEVNESHIFVGLYKLQYQPLICLGFKQ